MEIRQRFGCTIIVKLLPEIIESTLNRIGYYSRAFKKNRRALNVSGTIKTGRAGGKCLSNRPTQKVLLSTESYLQESQKNTVSEESTEHG